MARQQTAKKAAHTPLKSKQNPLPEKGGKLEKTDKKKPESSKAKGKAPVRQGKGQDSLREEILALGGDDGDYELLKDLDSDIDALPTSTSKKNATLSTDLAKFVRGLDFSSVKPKDAEDDPDEDESVDEEETEEKEAASDTPKQGPEKKEEKQKIPIPKVGPNAPLLVEPTPQWYTSVSALPPSKTTPASLSPQALSSKQSHVSSLHVSELSAYERATSANKLTASSSDAVFLQRVLSSGTLSDRLSALTLLAQSSPMHNTRALETLRGMAQKKGREESLKALRAICDWWVGGGAPDRKLKYFIDQPLNHSGVTDKHLLVWYFEDWLKKYFYSILQILETLSLDPLPYVRLQAMALIFTLLRDKPEQEQNLLRLLVNKLGDSERSVASRASYHLLQLLQAHPSMKAVIVHEISSLVLKPKHSSASTTTSGATHLKFTDDTKSTPKPKAKPADKTEKKDLQQEHSRYYAAITLNQIMLTSTEADRSVAVQLISLYFELFKEILWTPARPHEGASTEAAEDVGHTRYGKEKRKEQKKGKGKEKGEYDNGFAEVEDSNSRLISAILTGVNRALPFAKLSLEDVEISKHIDTLFLISHKSTFNISLQALRLIMQICQSLASTPSTFTSSSNLSTSITDRYYRALYASLLDTRLNSSSKQAMYLNLLLNSLKMDTKIERAKAFVKRFVQLIVGAGNGGVEFVVGGLYLLGELFKTQPALRDLLGKPRHSTDSDKNSNAYDPRKRDPQYADADACPMWELTPLLSHYHPTVRLHASQLLSGKELTANADLSLNTLSHFLDRFVFKNPKKPKPKGPSAMQPGAAAQDGTSIRIVKGAQADDVAVVNEESFWRKDVSKVPVDQVFFHKYFSQKNEKERAKAEKVAKRKGGAGADNSEEEMEDDDDDASEENSVRPVKGTVGQDEDEDESEGEAEIWKAIQATNPDLHPNADDSDDFSQDDSDSGLVSDAGTDSDDNKPEDADNRRSEDENGSSDDDEGVSLAEVSDAEDLIDLDDIKLPEGLIEYNSAVDDGDSASDADADAEWGGFDDANNEIKKKKRKREAREKEDAKQQKRKRRKLPTFATYEDYAKLIEEQPEDNI